MLKPISVLIDHIDCVNLFIFINYLYFELDLHQIITKLIKFTALLDFIQFIFEFRYIFNLRNVN